MDHVSETFWINVLKYILGLMLNTVFIPFQMSNIKNIIIIVVIVITQNHFFYKLSLTSAHNDKFMKLHIQINCNNNNNAKFAKIKIN